MKILKLKKTKDFDYKINLLEILKNAPAEGFSVDEVRKAVKAIDLLEVAKKEVSFEDADWEFVKKAVSEAKFRVATKELSEFLDCFI